MPSVATARSTKPSKTVSSTGGGVPLPPHIPNGPLIAARRPPDSPPPQPHPKHHVDHPADPPKPRHSSHTWNITSKHPIVHPANNPQFGPVARGRHGYTAPMLLPVLFAPMLLAFFPPSNPGTPALARLNGDWTVDLRPSATAPAHPMPMHLEINPDGTIKGTFYNGPIDLGRASDNKGRQCFAFHTADRSGLYHTSGCLTSAGTIEGQTWSEGRNFLLPWEATRSDGELIPAERK